MISFEDHKAFHMYVGRPSYCAIINDFNILDGSEERYPLEDAIRSEANRECLIMNYLGRDPASEQKTEEKEV